MRVGEDPVQNKGTGDGSANQAESGDEKCFQKREIRDSHDAQSDVYQKEGYERGENAKPVVYQ